MYVVWMLHGNLHVVKKYNQQLVNTTPDYKTGTAKCFFYLNWKKNSYQVTIKNIREEF